MGRQGTAVQWLPRPGVSIDPKNLAEADEIEISLGIKSPQQCIRERGRDPDAVLDEIAKWRELMPAATNAPADRRRILEAVA
jgi:capsid protein